MAAESQVLTFALAIYVGLTLTSFFNSLSRDIVLPLLSPLASTEAGIAKLYIQFGNSKINIGDVIVNTINLVVLFAVISFVLPYIREYIPTAGRR
jgi:large-conductance mechanosensitive channel